MEKPHDLHINNMRFLRVIETARSKKSINKAAKNGFRLIIKKVEPSSQIRSKYSVVQHKKTGEIAALTLVKSFKFKAIFTFCSIWPSLVATILLFL